MALPLKDSPGFDPSITLSSLMIMCDICDDSGDMPISVTVRLEEWILHKRKNQAKRVS